MPALPTRRSPSMAARKALRSASDPAPSASTIPINGPTRPTIRAETFPLPAGPEGYRQILTFVTQVLAIRYDVLDEFATEDRIVVRARAHGIAVAPVHGEAFAGRPYAMDTLHVYRTAGDRLAEHWGVRDELGVLQQIGALPEPVMPER